MNLTRRFEFRAVHCLRYVEGPCAEVHGHSFWVDVTLTGQVDEVGVLVDEVELIEFQSLIDECYSHKHLNEVPPFDYRNPTLENLTTWFYDLARSRFADGVQVARVRITQDGSMWCEIDAP